MPIIIYMRFQPLNNGNVMLCQMIIERSLYISYLFPESRHDQVLVPAIVCVKGNRKVEICKNGIWLHPHEPGNRRISFHKPQQKRIPNPRPNKSSFPHLQCIPNPTTVEITIIHLVFVDGIRPQMMQNNMNKHPNCL